MVDHSAKVHCSDWRAINDSVLLPKATRVSLS